MPTPARPRNTANLNKTCIFPSFQHVQNINIVLIIYHRTCTCFFFVCYLIRTFLHNACLKCILICIVITPRTTNAVDPADGPARAIRIASVPAGDVTAIKIVLTAATRLTAVPPPPPPLSLLPPLLPPPAAPPPARQPRRPSSLVPREGGHVQTRSSAFVRAGLAMALKIATTAVTKLWTSAAKQQQPLHGKQTQKSQQRRRQQPQLQPTTPDHAKLR